MNIIFVRHGETEYPINNAGEKLVYGPDAWLTSQGVQDIYALGSLFKRKGIVPSRIHSSPYERANQTALTIASILNDPPIEYHNDLRDVDTPSYLYQIVGTTPVDYYAGDLPQGHESLSMLTNRSVGALQRILSANRKDTMHLIVSHRDTILSVIHFLQFHRPADSLTELTATVPLERGEAIVASVRDGSFAIIERISQETYRRGKESE